MEWLLAGYFLDSCDASQLFALSKDETTIRCKSQRRTSLIQVGREVGVVETLGPNGFGDGLVVEVGAICLAEVV